MSWYTYSFPGGSGYYGAWGTGIPNNGYMGNRTYNASPYGGYGGYGGMGGGYGAYNNPYAAMYGGGGGYGGYANPYAGYGGYGRSPGYGQMGFGSRVTARNMAARRARMAAWDGVYNSASDPSFDNRGRY